MARKFIIFNKLLLLFSIIIFSFHSFTKADDISGFEIEGFSLNESLLKYFSKDKIDEEINSEWSLKYGNDFIQIGIGYGNDFPLLKKLENYDEVTIVLKTNDLSYKIFSIAGKIFCKNHDECIGKKEEISFSLKQFFGDNVLTEEYTDKHEADKTGKSITYNTEFKFINSGHIIEVSFYDWSKKFEEEKSYEDNIKVIMHSDEFSDFLVEHYE